MEQEPREKSRRESSAEIYDAPARYDYFLIDFPSRFYCFAPSKKQTKFTTSEGGIELDSRSIMQLFSRRRLTHKRRVNDDFEMETSSLIV